VAIPKGFRHELRELTGFRSIRGIATAGYACLAMTEMFYAVPPNRKINYNLIHKKGIDYLEKCGMIIMYRYASNYDA
jgi:hypothetical protein